VSSRREGKALEDAAAALAKPVDGLSAAESVRGQENLEG
jgi:hypothetical protein